MEMDLTGLWTWTVPLWGLGLMVFVLAAILTSPAEIITRIPGYTPTGGIPGVGAAVEMVAPAAVGQGGGGHYGGQYRGSRSRRH